MKIESPNLPCGKVTLFAAAESYPELKTELENLGAEVITVKKDMTFEMREADHPDMHLHHLGDKRIMLYKEDEYLAKELLNKGFEPVFAHSSKQGKYPECTALNALRIGDLLLCSEKTVDRNLREYAEKNKIEIINCRQGYARCASCVVSENAVITADKSVYNALKDRVDVLLISQGFIRHGENYDGMIGGCSSMIDKNKLAFFGDVTSHPDHKLIENFLNNHSVTQVSLGNGELTDVGTFIPLETE